MSGVRIPVPLFVLLSFVLVLFFKCHWGGNNLNKKIAILSGDGIGPEIMDEAIKVLKIIEKKYNHQFELSYADVGGVAIDNYGKALPQKTLEICKSSDSILFGSVGGPKWEKLPPDEQPERGALLPLRKYFNLYANLRPAIIYPALVNMSPIRSDVVSEGFDLLVVRELTGGIYFGQPKGKEENRAFDTLIYTRGEIVRIAHIAFKSAGKRKKKVTSIDKANVLYSMVFWREVVEEVSRSYPDIELEHMYVDNAAMQLIRNPTQFDVLLCGNMFGDIISDEASMVTGSLGMLPSASLSYGGFGLYEPSGGSAPDIAGKGIANPIAQILSLSMMLEYSFGLKEESFDISNAINEVLSKGYRTKDIAENNLSEEKLVNTEKMGELVADSINKKI